MTLSDIEFSEEVNQHYQQYLTDEAGIVKNGFAEKIFFPKSIDEISQIIKEANHLSKPVTISGGGTGVSGGRVPLGGWILATDKMTKLWDNVPYQGEIKNWKDPETNIEYQFSIEVKTDKEAFIHIPISITLKSLQTFLREEAWFYPPDPTERLAFVGGNIATNASGARSFKYGVTRHWVEELILVLPNGDIIDISQSDKFQQEGEGKLSIFKDVNGNQKKITFTLPSYHLPKVNKNVAGPAFTPQDRPLDLFIGSGGLFGVIGQAKLKLIRPPTKQISIFVYTPTIDVAIDLVNKCREQKIKNQPPIPMSLEFLGPRAVDIMRSEDISISDEAKCVIILEQDAESEDQLDKFIEFWLTVFEDFEILDTSVALNHKEIEHHKYLRHKVPETINSIARSHGQNKLGTDYSVPYEKFSDLMALAYQLGDEFEVYQNKRQTLENAVGYAVWAHAGDAHIHLNLLPRNDEENEFAKSLFIRMMGKIIEYGGSIAAEHGLGKKQFGGKPALIYQYGDSGINEVKRMKKEIDPNVILNRGNLVPFD